MNDLTHPECPADLGKRIAALNTVMRRLSEDAEWLRGEAKRLRAEHARVRLGAPVPLWVLLQLQHEEAPARVSGTGAR